MRHTTWIILFFVLICSLTVRFYDLDAQGLWSDEGYSVYEAKKPILQFINDARFDHNPPLYYLLLKIWIWIFGESDFSVRSLSAILGSFVVVVGFLLAKKHYSQRAGLITAILLTVSLPMVEYSQEARAYMLVTLLVMLSYYFREKFWPYVIYSTLALYTHYYALLFLIPQALAYKQQEWRRAAVTIFLAFIPGIILLAVQLTHFADASLAVKPTILSVSQLFFSHTSNWALLGLLWVLAVYSLATEKNKIVWAWWLVPIIISLTISLIEPILEVRYLLPAIPAFLLLAARGIDTIPKRWIQFFVIGIVLLFSVNTLSWYFDHPQKEDWIGATMYLDQRAEYKDAIVFYPGFPKELLYDKYSNGNNATAIMLTYDTRPLGETEHTKLQEYLWFNRVFVVTSHWMSVDDVAASLRGFHVVNTTQFRKITITEFRQ